MADVMNHSESELDSLSRIYDVRLSGEQRQRLIDKELDGNMKFGRIVSNDVLGEYVTGIKSDFFWADEQQVNIIVPGQEIAKYLLDISAGEQSETEQLSAEAISRREISAGVYKSRAYMVPGSRTEFIAPKMIS